MFIFICLVYLSQYSKCIASVEPQDNQETQQFYRISMVSSHENPGSPALFIHGKSPVWDPVLQSLYFVDARDNKVHKLDYVSGKITSKYIGYGEVNVVSLVSGSQRVLVSVRSALYLLEWGMTGDEALRLVTTLDMGLPDNVISDGKPDAEGRFWAGTKGPERGDEVAPDKGTLYTIEQESFAKPRIQIRPVSISSGLVWSLNNSVLYYIDSATQKVEAFDYDLHKGDLSGRRTILDITNYGYEDAFPDGMTIDSHGKLWVALMLGGTVLHIDPDKGQVIFGYKLPVSRVSAVCWGGPNFDELFVTTARGNHDVTNEPLGGAIFTIRGTGSRGHLTRHNEHFNAFEFTNLTFTHAESPVWDTATNTLFWVDVINQDVHSLNYYTGSHDIKHIAYGEVNIVMPIENSRRLLVGVRCELFLLDWYKPGDAALRLVAALDEGFPDNVLNEGKADAIGRFWGGTKGRQNRHIVTPDEGTLYSLEGPNFIPRIHVKPVTISNGLVWSLNNTVMYYVDSFTRKVEAFDFDLLKGRLSNRRTIYDVSEDFPEPVIADGMTIDIHGFLWVALMFEGRVIRIDPDRRYVVETYKLPVSRTTSMTWAGPALDNLVVTTSRRDMDVTALRQEPLSGSLFILHRLGTTGVPDYKFVFPNADNY
ncbi:unnamed protein product [Arctia plantaginis]|uniref:SMP-30/Gluconolactonase/LRE-like region domain-containing protein n=1 Tax=Arctia plantaginis TaxID=874455 RepID=A0A8S0ZWI3_ARCPL|nr:unnamed protein product [Arctia plantaginis]CAB3238449.1 unnamed protein product [Arctia plantaginis]